MIVVADATSAAGGGGSGGRTASSSAIPGCTAAAGAATATGTCLGNDREDERLSIRLAARRILVERVRMIQEFICYFITKFICN